MNPRFSWFFSIYFLTGNSYAKRFVSLTCGVHRAGYILCIKHVFGIYFSKGKGIADDIVTSLCSSRAEASRSPADSCAEKACSRRAGRACAWACACATERLRLGTRGSPEPRRRRTVRRSGAGQRGRADSATRKPKEYAGDAHCGVGKFAGRPKRAEDGRSCCPRAAMVRRLDDVVERRNRKTLRPW
jgi:hypothetical protein